MSCSEIPIQCHKGKNQPLSIDHKRTRADVILGAGVGELALNWVKSKKYIVYSGPWSSSLVYISHCTIHKEKEGARAESS